MKAQAERRRRRAALEALLAEQTGRARLHDSLDRCIGLERPEHAGVHNVERAGDQATRQDESPPPRSDVSSWHRKGWLTCVHSRLSMALHRCSIHVLKAWHESQFYSFPPGQFPKPQG